MKIYGIKKKTEKDPCRINFSKYMLIEVFLKDLGSYPGPEEHRKHPQLHSVDLVLMTFEREIERLGFEIKVYELSEVVEAT